MGAYQDALLQCLCYPLFYFLNNSAKKGNDRRNGYIDPVPAPKGLSTRPRALTIPLPLETSKLQKTSKQLDCSLLVLLPLEVRQLIYQECLGGMLLHLDLCGFERRLTHVVCPHKDPRLCVETCGVRSLRLTQSVEYSPHNLLPLLLSCRQIYSEAINLIYSSNIFSAKSPKTVVYLSSFLIPERMNAIRTIQLQLHYDRPPRLPPYAKSGDGRARYVDKMWTAVWHSISQLKGLYDLRVELKISLDYWIHEWQEREVEVFQPLKEVTDPLRFELHLPYENGADAGALDDLPCTIVRNILPHS